jgi:Mg-chelatase subunit ChlD
MKRIRYFLIISLIIHTIILILSIYIILPKVDISKIRSKIDVDIVKVNPQAKEYVKTPAKTIKEDKGEVKPKPEKIKTQEPDGIKPVDQATFSSLTKIPTFKSSRQDIVETRSDNIYLSQVKPPESSNLVFTSVPTHRINTVDKRELSTIPILNSKVENIRINIGSSGYDGPKVGTVGSSSMPKGESSRYIDAMNTVAPRGGVVEFANILPSIAQGILQRVTQKKLDVVFIIDTTGSMEDNVLGIKDYILRFLEPLEEKKLDVELGLVTFSDISARKEKVFDLTDKPDKFKKWLDKTIFYGGGDLPESGYEAIVTALGKIDFRKSAQRFFIFMSDAPQHDFDYDGKSRYTLDRIISMLNEKNVSIEVIGLDILLMKQLAYGTGGQWKPIPGGNLRLDVPEPTSAPKIHSRLVVSTIPDFLEDSVIVDFDKIVPDWVDFSYKVLNPQGAKIIGTLTYRKEVSNKSEKKVEIPVKFSISVFKSGVYTLIYRTLDSYGNQNILRQTFELQKES